MGPVSASAAAYAAIGVVGLARPALVPGLFGGSAPSSASRTEIRAVYGGLPLAFAAALARAGGRRSAADAATIRAIALASAGMAAGRLSGAALERDLPPWPTGAFLALEAALAAALFGAAGRAQDQYG